MSNSKIHCRFPIYDLDYVAERRDPSPCVLSYRFIDLDTGEILCTRKIPQQVVFNCGSSAEKEVMKIVASAIRGFSSGRSLSFEIILSHPQNNCTFQGIF